MSRLLPYANTPNSFAIRDRSINSCEKRDSADAVVVRNAIVPLGKDQSAAKFSRAGICPAALWRIPAVHCTPDKAPRPLSNARHNNTGAP